MNEVGWKCDLHPNDRQHETPVGHPGFYKVRCFHLDALPSRSRWWERRGYWPPSYKMCKNFYWEARP